MPPTLSVIIPTHNRPQILRRCLEHLERQTIARDLEVIVVHDDERSEVGGWRSDTMTIAIVPVPPCHQGTARNRGVAQATAQRVLFIGDDIFLHPEACEKHASGSAALLGYTTWDPALAITPVMRWLEQTGWQFGYPLIEAYAGKAIPRGMQHRFTYTSHISLPTSVAASHPFREDVSLYGWEDVEWGMRLAADGVTLLYEPRAIGYHHHPMTLEQSLARMRTLGASAVHLSRIAPTLDRLPQGWKLLAYRALTLLPTMRGRHARAFLRGIADATFCKEH